MKSIHCIALVVALLAIPSLSVAVGAEPATPSGGFRFEAVSEQSLGLWEGAKPVLVYNHSMIARPDVPGARARACYVHPVYGMDGEVLSDDFPKDHLYHRGMYWAWPHIKIGEREYDLWSARGELKQKFVRWLNQDASGARAKLEVENGWFADDKQLVLERIAIEVHPAAASSRAIDLTLAWTPIEQPLTLWGAEGKSYGGFNFRFAPRKKTVITVPENAQPAEGTRAAAGRISDDLVVTRLPWADFVGDFSASGELSGAAIFVDPRHPNYPPTWMLRHYGLASVGWPGVESQTFSPGPPVTLRYRVWIHRGTPSAADIQREYDTFRAAVP